MSEKPSAGSAGRILVVDDEKNIVLVIQTMLTRAGFEVVSFTDPLFAKKALEREAFDAVVTDLYMPNMSGLELLAFCEKEGIDVPLVMITAFGTVEAAVSALKKGAFDFITKPFDQAELLAVLKKAVATSVQRRQEPRGLSGDEIVGESAAIKGVYKIVSKIADSSATVLILGESGTGKERVAFEIHRRSNRATKPFVKVNCAAIPGTLIEAELFGFEKGAFTGAINSKPGRFELAHEGTLFLDEIGETSLDMQVKLLRAIQEQEFEKVGGVQTLKVDVRIVAATNKDLQEEVKAGRFREDLFYRLNVVPIVIPPLRDRREDIGPLVKYFLGRFNLRLKKNISGVSEEVMQSFLDFAWPGNIRQLENVIERMVLLCEGESLQADGLPEEIAAVLGKNGESGLGSADSESQEGQSFKEIIRKQTQLLERELIEKALEETQGNVTRTAERLGLSRKGLQLKIRELGIKRIEE